MACSQKPDVILTRIFPELRIPLRAFFRTQYLRRIIQQHTQQHRDDASFFILFIFIICPPPMLRICVPSSPPLALKLKVHESLRVIRAPPYAKYQHEEDSANIYQPAAPDILCKQLVQQVHIPVFEPVRHKQDQQREQQ